MPVRISDYLKQQNNLTSFPIAYGDSIWLDKNKGVGTADYSDLQTMYNNDELGGGGSSIQVDTMPIASAENENMIVEFVGESGTYQNGYFYQNIGSGDPKVYSWVQKNVQPSNATANDVSYDNTTSELVATNVQSAIDEIKGGLGTASGKNFTDLVRPNSHDLIESGSVYSAINNALSSIYTPRGELTCAELTSSLLIEDNVGNIYTMSDSGITSSLFINGAGQTINVNDNVGIIKAGSDTYLFNLMGEAFDLHDYQKKELPSGAMIENVIPSNASINNKLVAKSDVEKDMIASSSSIQSLQALLDDAQPQNWGAGTYQGALVINGWGVGTYQMTKTDNTSANHKTVIHGTFSTASDGARPFIATYTSSNVWNIIYVALTSYVDAKVREVFRVPYNISITDFLARFTQIGIYKGEVFIEDSISGVAINHWCSYDVTISSATTNAYVGDVKLTDLSTGTVYIYQSYGLNAFNWNLVNRLATTENLTNTTLYDYQLSVGGDNYAWFDLGTSTSTSNSQAFLFYEITYGRVDGLQSKVLVSCGGTMANNNYFKIVNLSDAPTGAYAQFKLDNNKHLWLGMQSYCYACVKVYGRWAGMGSKTTEEPAGTVIPVHTCVTDNDLKAFVPYNQTDGTYLMLYASQHWQTSSNKALCKAYTSAGGLVFAGILQWTGDSGSAIDNRVVTRQAGSGSIIATNEMGTVAFSDTVTCVEMHRLGDHD